MQQQPRTYNSRQLADKLAAYRQVSLSPDRLRRVLKKRGEMDGALAVAIEISKTRNNKQFKQADLDMLMLAAAAGEIEIKYVESGELYLLLTWSTETLRTNSATR